MKSLWIELGFLVLGGSSFACFVWMMRASLLSSDTPAWQNQSAPLPASHELFAGEEIEIPQVSESQLKHRQNLKLAKDSPERVKSTIKKWLHENENADIEDENAGIARS